jgi:hypothetical protein
VEEEKMIGIIIMASHITNSMIELRLDNEGDFELYALVFGMKSKTFGKKNISMINADKIFI